MKSIDEACSDPATQHDILGYFDLGLMGPWDRDQNFNRAAWNCFIVAPTDVLRMKKNTQKNSSYYF